MADAIRLISIRRGYDPRDFALVLLGGAGPIHGGRLAEQLSITKMVVPAVPGVLSALGLLVASIEHDHAETVATRSELAVPADLEAAFLRLEDIVAAQMHADQVPVGMADTVRSVDGRYVGQGYTLEIPITAPVSSDSLATYRDDFHSAHERIYGHANRGASIELVNARVVQSWNLPRIELRQGAPGLQPSNPGSRMAYFDELGGYSAVPVFRRDLLRVGDTITGPALVEQPDTTLVVYPGHRAELDAAGNIIVTVPAGRAGGDS